MELSMPEVSILVVEDEAITLEFLVTTLARKYPKTRIHKALNGRIGLELFREFSPGIVITDIKMPEISGVQMTEIIHELKPETKFIVLSGDRGELTMGTSVENKFKIDHYIDKPIDFLDLFAAIEKCLGEITSLIK